MYHILNFAIPKKRNKINKAKFIKHNQYNVKNGYPSLFLQACISSRFPSFIKCIMKILAIESIDHYERVSSKHHYDIFECRICRRYQCIAEYSSEDFITPLFALVRLRKLNQIRRLVKTFGANVNAESNPSRLTPLHVACGNICEKKSFEVIRFLVEVGGADILKVDEANMSCLMYCVSRFHCLFGGGENIYERNFHPQCRYRICEYLLKRGAVKLINIQDHYHGYTVLHLAAIVGDLNLVRLFLSYGADPHIKCYNHGIDVLFTLCGSSYAKNFEAKELILNFLINNVNYPLETIREAYKIFISCIPEREESKIRFFMEKIDNEEFSELDVAEKLLGYNHHLTLRLVLAKFNFLHSNVANDETIVSIAKFYLKTVNDTSSIYLNRGILSCFLKSLFRLHCHSSSQHVFDNIFEGIKIIVNRRIDEEDHNYSLLHLIKMASTYLKDENLKSISVESFKNMIHFISENTSPSDLLLHIQRLYIESYYIYENYNDVYNYKFTGYYICLFLKFLMICKANINISNKDNESPFFLFLEYSKQFTVAGVDEIISCFISNGAHLDQRSTYNGKCPLDYLRNVDIMEMINLKCLCARVVQKYKIKFKYNEIPTTLHDFIKLH